MRLCAVARLAAAAALALFAGCFPGYVYVSLKSTPGSNNNAPLYMLVRTVEPKQYATQSYSEVASLLDSPDASVLRTQLLYPGRHYRFHLKKPAKGAVGLYFLFTKPGGAWSALLVPPLPWQFSATLRDNLIKEQVAR